MSGGDPHVHDLLLCESTLSTIHEFLKRKKSTAHAQLKLKKTSIFSGNTASEYVANVFNLHRHPKADYELGAIVRQLAHAEHRASSHSSKDVFRIGESAEEDRKASQPPELIPLHIQSELTLLWRTLAMFESMDDSEMLLDFYSELLKVLVQLEPLALSTKWHALRHRSEATGSAADLPPCVVGLPTAPPRKHAAVGGKDSPRGSDMPPAVPVLNHPDLSYLKPREPDDDGGDDGRVSSAHDPLGIVQRFFTSAEYLSESLLPEERSVPLSVCLALAIKSGRASLIVKVIYLLMTEENRDLFVDFDFKWLDDIVHPKNPGGHNVSDMKHVVTDKLSTIDIEDTSYTAKILSYFSSPAVQSGYVFSFGKADHAKLGHGDTHSHRLVPTVLEHLKALRITKVTSMSTYSIAIDDDGIPYIWGTGGTVTAPYNNRAFDVLPMVLDALPTRLPVLDVSCGLGHALFLVKGPRVFAWGNGGNGRLGLGSMSDRAEAEPILDLDGHDIVSVSCGASHSMALTRGGRLYSWGKNSQGQCGRGGSGEDVLKPVAISSVKDEFCQMAAGWDHSLGLTSAGSVYAWGSGYKDSRRGGVPPVLGLGHSDARPAPEKITSLNDHFIVALSSGWDHCLALDVKGNVFSWGSGQNGKLGHGSDANVPAPAIISQLSVMMAEKGSSIVKISAGCEHSACIDSSGALYTWGHGDGGRLGHGDNSSVSVPKVVITFDKIGAQPLAVYCGDKFTMVVASKCTNVVEVRSDMDGAFCEKSLHASVYRSILEQWVPAETPEIGGGAKGNSCVATRCYDIGHLLLSRLSATLSAAAADALISSAENDKPISESTKFTLGENHRAISYEREQAYSVELDAVTFQHFGLLLNLLSKQFSQYDTCNVEVDDFDVNKSEEVREAVSLLELLLLLQQNLEQLGVKSRRQTLLDDFFDSKKSNIGKPDLSLSSRLPTDKFESGQQNARKAPTRSYIDLDEGFGDEVDEEFDDIEGSSFLELCEQLRRDAADHIPLRSCSESNSSDEGGSERENDLHGPRQPRFMSPDDFDEGRKQIDALAHTQHQHRAQLNSSLDADDMYSALCSTATVDTSANDNKKEFDIVMSELLSDGANPGDVFDNANIVLPTDNTRTSNGNTVDVGNEPRWQASSGPNFMTRPVIMGGIVQMSGELSVQLSSGSDHSSSRATASHRLDRDIHLPGGHSRNATPNTAHRRGSHPTGVSDAVVSADSAAQTVEIIGDDFERDRAASVGALRTGSNSPAMSQESWEGRASNEAEECRKSDSYDENDISNNYDNIGNRDMFVSNSYNHEEEYVAALDGGDDDASSLEIQKALLMSICSDTDPFVDRTNWRKSTDLTPGRSSLSEIGFGEISLMRMLMSNLRAILQATAVDTFEQLRSLIMLDKRSKKDIHRYKRNAILWYRVNNVIRSGMTSLYTHLDITEVFIGLLKNSESQLPFAHGICTGLCEERVFTGLARTVLRDVAADFVAVVRHGSVYITPSRGSSKMRSIPNSASAQFSSPNKTSGGETLGYLDLKKAFHFVHNYFVMQNYEFFGPDIPGDLCCANPMKATAKAYFSFLRMCISFIIEILEPTITSKIYLKSIFEGNGLGNPVDPSLLLGGRLLYEMLALVSAIMMSDLLKVVDDSRERSPAIDWSTIADSNNWRFTSVFIPFLADYYLQSNSLEVSIVYLPHALAQLSAFLKCMNMLPAESEGYQWMTGQCRWVLLYLAKIYAILRDNYLLRTVPTLSGSLQSIAGLWEPKGLMSWRSGWFREVSAIDQHKIMVCGWLVPLIMTDDNIAVTEASFAPIGFTEIAATHPAVVSRISPSSTSCAENSSCPPQSSSYLLSSWVYGLLDTLPPVRVDTETSAKLFTVEYPSPDALKHAESVNEFLWNFFFDKDGPLNRMQVDESISSKARKILADKCSSEDEGVMAVVLAHLLREPTLIKLVGNSADCVCVLSGTVLAHFHKSFSNENPRRSESFILVHTLILSLLLESGRRDDNEIASINCLISLFIARGMPDNTCDASADGKGISSSAAAMLLNYYITSLVVVIVSIDHMLRTANCHGNIDYALYKLYQKTVSILHSIQYMKPLRGICSFNSLSNDLKPNFDYDSLFSDIIHGGTRIRSALSLETLTGVNIWDTLKLDAYSKAYFESSNSLLDINSLPLKDMFMLSLLLASPVQVIEMQNFVGWKAACGESTSLSFTLAASVASRLQVAPNMLQYFLSAMQSMTLDSLPSSESLMSLSHETRPSKSVANPSQQKLDLTRKCMKCLSVSDFDKSKISSQLQKFDFDISEQIMAYSRGFHRNSHELLDKIRSCVSDLEMPSLLTNFHALVNQFVGHIVGQCVFYCQYSAYIEKGSYNAPGNKGKNRSPCHLNYLIESLRQINFLVSVYGSFSELLQVKQAASVSASACCGPMCAYKISDIICVAAEKLLKCFPDLNLLAKDGAVVSNCIHELAKLLNWLNRSCNSLGTMRRHSLELDQRNGYSCLHLCVKPITVTNSHLFQNLQSPTGSFKLQFWVYVPTLFISDTIKNVASQNADKSDLIYIHIVSRLPEASDANQIALLERSDLKTIKCLPSVFLCIDISAGSFHLNVSASSGGDNKPKTGAITVNSLPAATLFAEINSKCLPCDRWLKCAVELFEEDEELLFTERDKYSLELLVNDERHGIINGIFRSQSLHHNILLGTIPTAWTKILDENNLIGELFLIADLSFANRAKKSDKQRGAPEFISNSSEDIFSHLPVSYISQRVSFLSNGIVKCTELLASVIQMSTQLDVQSLKEENIGPLLMMAFEVIVLGNIYAQENAFDLIRNIFHIFAEIKNEKIKFDLVPQFVKHLLFLVGLTTGFLESTSTVLLDNIDKKTKKSPEITVQLSEMIKVWSFRVAESRSKYVSGKGSFSSISSRCYGAFEFIIDCGAGCAVCGIDAISCSSIFQVNENTILLKSASIFALAISSKILSTKELLLDPSLPTQLVQFLGFVAGGGWIPAICHRSVVDLSPRALFLKSDPLKLETTIFPCCTTVQLYTGGPSYNTGKPVVLLSGSVGTVSTAKLGISIGSECGILKPISGISSSVDLVPSDGKYLIPATELLSLRDPFQILEMKNVSDCFLTTTFPGVPELSQQLRDAVSAVASSNKAEFMGNLPNEANKTAPLTLSMVQIRCLLLQMVQLDLSSLSSKEADDLPAFSSVLKNDFEKILQLSAVDYVTGVLSVLDTLKLKPGQLDILKNLLREEDINFLEKIVLRLWPALRHVQSLNQTSSDPKVKSYSASDKVPCSILAGEVQIVDSKIRALNHFPSVRILDITLRKNTGRWFYECTLLTDGLMQIGWADKTFRCDPVCGQGIGDHPHSWAFDGFRTKKWNVSCENYGGRWHVGDVVGVLIDMDLLEMSFYLNGHDLGVAFSGFHCDTIYPALSMNVRQAVRINYGQYNFIYPPSIVDGIRYHPISDSVGVNSTSAASPDKKKDKFGKRGNIRECSPADKAITDDSVDQSLSRESDGRSEPASVHLMQRTDRVDEDHSEIIDSKENSKVSLVEHEHKDIPIDEECDYPMAPARNRNRLRFSDSEDLAADGGADSKAVDISSPNAADGNNSDDGSHENESNGSDEDEDGSEEDDMDDVDDDVMDEEGSRDRREIGNRHRQDELNPELELRRQALIENLIGMGFPVDWALRAAEHCDPSVSESAAISWIIERMELEQAKLDEFEGSDSRMVEEEEYEEGGETGYEHLQRATRGAEAAAENRMNTLNRSNALSSAQNAGAICAPGCLGTPGLVTAASAVLSAAATNGSASTLSVENGNATASAATGIMSDNVSNNSFGRSTDNIATMFRLKDEEGVMRTYMPIDENLGNGSGVWNGEFQYPLIIPGRYTARQRHNGDKQDILLQVSDLNIEDLYPIIMAAQFSLCVLYARSIVLRTLRMIAGGTVLSSLILGETQMEIYLREGNHKYFRVLLSTLFKIGVSSSEVPDRLFPTLLRSMPDKLPFLHPFVTKEIIDLVQTFSAVENKIAKSNADIAIDYVLSSSISDVVSTRLNCCAVNESSLPIMQTLKVFLQRLYQIAFVASSPSSELCRKLIHSLVDEALCDLDEATMSNYYRCDWISGEGYDRIGGQGAEEFVIERETRNATDSKNSSGKFNGFSFYTKPKVFVLWSYFVLQTLVKEELANVNETQQLQWSDEDGDQKQLISIQFLFRLLKICSCPNIALRFCVLDVSLLVMTALIRKAQRTCSTEISDKSASLVYISAIGDIIADSGMPRLLSSRIKFEVLNRKLHSKYAVESIIFFLKWRKLVTQLMQPDMPKSKAALPRLNGESDCIKKFQFFQISDSQMKQSLMLEVFCDHLSGLSVTSSAGNSLKTLHPDSFSTGHNTKAITKSLFHINDLSSTSITVSWNLSDEITRMRMLASHGTNLGQSALSVSNPIRHSAKDVKLAIVLSVTSHVCTSSITDSRVGEFDTEKWVHQTTDVTGIFCIDGLLPDTKYAVNMTIRWNTNIPTVVTAASTTLAGISSPVAQSLPGSLAARLMRSSGVASSGISSGDVSPTLSGTSVADMKDPTSGKLAKEEIDAVKMTLHVVSRTNISSNEGKIDSDNLIGDSEMDGALQTTAFSLNNSRNSSKSIRSPHSSESTALMASGDTASYSSESVLQLTAADIDAFVSGVPTISSVSLVVATDTEQLFLLDNSTLPSSLLLGQNALTVKNKTNKKWSTARATISLTSGIHRWGVHIDRCISKNIFIGVVTEDARSDNYVGCDRFGWAFLANRAVWHNKSKIRSYGELFVAGDMIVVTLNLDLGTMTFTLNGKDLGIAVEGLSGSFFPAFSLYNEDDQITLIPIKGTHLPLSSYYSQKNGPEFKSTISAGGNVIDRKSNGNAVSHTIAGLFDRIEVLSSLLGSISSNPGPDAVSFEMSSELYVRWMRWMRGGVTRTICSSAGYFVTISLSDSDIFNFFPPFSDIFFSAGETVQWANNYAIVLGVGSHRLWFQSLESGNVSGLTRETLAQLQARHIIRPIDLNQKAVAEKIIQITEQSAPLPAENYTAFADFSSAINCQHKYWDHDLDTALVRWIELIARKLGVHVCNLTFHSISSPAAAVSKAYSHEFSAVLHSFYKLFAPLSKIPLINIRLRALFLISANDMLVPLLPLLPKPENENAFEHSSWFLASDIAELLTKSKHVLFRQVKLEFASRQGSDFQPSAQYANVLPRSGSKRNLLSGPVGGKTQIYGESSANFCSAHYQLSPTPYVMPVASYFSNSSEPYYSNIVNSGVNTVARIASDNIDADTSAVVLTETVKSISAAKTSSMRLEAAMEELQLQQGFQSQQILFGAATTVGDTHDTGVSGLNVCISNVSKKNRSPRGIGAASGADGRVTGIPTLELEASHAFAHSLFENAVAVGSELVLISDPRWILLGGYQSSLLGQLFRRFETMSECFTSMGGTFDPAYKSGSSNNDVSPRLASMAEVSRTQGTSTMCNSSLWEINLKKYYRPGSMWEDHIIPRERKVPFLIRPALQKRFDDAGVKSKTKSSGDEPLLPSLDSVDYFNWLLEMQQQSYTINGLSNPAIAVGSVCEFNMLDKYLRAAVRQIYPLVAGTSNEDRNLKSTGEYSLMLHAFHALGVAIGLSIRFGVTLGDDLSLPEECWRVFVDERAEISDSPMPTTAGFLTEDLKSSIIRHGITTIIPEVSLCYWSWRELRALVCSEIVSTSPSLLRRLTLQDIYSEDMKIMRDISSKIHIELFWLAFAELNEVCRKKFLKQVWSEQDLPDEIYHYDTDYFELNESAYKAELGAEVDALPQFSRVTGLPAPLFVRLLEPTTENSLVMLDVSTETATVTIPRYRSVSDATRQLIYFIKNL